MLAKDFPNLQKDFVAYETFRRKWRYLFAYAGAGFAGGYITCHMITFIRQVGPTNISRVHSAQSF